MLLVQEDNLLFLGFDFCKGFFMDLAAACSSSSFSSASSTLSAIFQFDVMMTLFQYHSTPKNIFRQHQ